MVGVVVVLLDEAVRVEGDLLHEEDEQVAAQHHEERDVVREVLHSKKETGARQTVEKCTETR